MGRMGWACAKPLWMGAGQAQLHRPGGRQGVWIGAVLGGVAMGGGRNKANFGVAIAPQVPPLPLQVAYLGAVIPEP